MAKIDPMTQDQLRSKMVRAAWDGNLARLTELMAAAEEPSLFNISTSGEGTPLMSAAEGGHVDCVRALLPRSNPRARDEDGDTALIVAAFSNAVECVAALASVSDANAVDSDGKTALLWAASRENKGILDILIPLSDLETRDNDGRTALLVAIAHNDLAVVKALAAAGVDFRAVDKNKQTALMLAVGNKECAGDKLRALVQLAMSAAPDFILAENISGKSAMEYVVAHGAWECADLVAEHSDPARAEKAFEEGGAEKMPRWAAKKEAEALGSVVQKTSAARLANGASEPLATGRKPRSL